MEVHTAKKVIELIFARGLAQVPKPSDIDAWLGGCCIAPFTSRLEGATDSSLMRMMDWLGRITPSRR